MTQNLETITTVEEMTEWCKKNYGENIDCSDVRSACETLWNLTKQEISEDAVMIELGIGE